MEIKTKDPLGIPWTSAYGLSLYEWLTITIKKEISPGCGGKNACLNLAQVWFWPGAITGLSFLLGFTSKVFPSPRKLTFLNSNLTWLDPARVRSSIYLLPPVRHHYT